MGQSRHRYKKGDRVAVCLIKTSHYDEDNTVFNVAADIDGDDSHCIVVEGKYSVVPSDLAIVEFTHYENRRYARWRIVNE